MLLADIRTLQQILSGGSSVSRVPEELGAVQMLTLVNGGCHILQLVIRAQSSSMLSVGYSHGEARQARCDLASLTQDLWEQHWGKVSGGSYVVNIYYKEDSCTHTPHFVAFLLNNFFLQIYLRSHN